MIKVSGGGNVNHAQILPDQRLFAGMAKDAYLNIKQDYVEICREDSALGKRYVGSPQEGFPLVLEYVEVADANA